MTIDNSLILFQAKNTVPKLNVESDKLELKKQTDKFESVLLKMLLDVSLKDDNLLFGKDAGNKIYSSMYRNEISKLGGGSFGFSQMLFDYLQKNVK